MKKLISLLLVFAVVLSFAACGANPKEKENSGKTENEFASINEFEPSEDGSYKIHSKAGLKNIANHPEATFMLLCDIDMEGEEWVPIGTQDAPFTGVLNGQYFTISNFTINQAVDGNMGFIGVSKGNLTNLNLKDVTVNTTEDTKFAGALVGINSGNVRRCEIRGTINAEKLAAGAVVGGTAGKNTKLLESLTSGVKILCSAAGEAIIGGGAGVQDGGKFQYCTMEAPFTVTGAGNKKIGLFIGSAKDVELKECKYTGEQTAVDNKIYMECIGEQENVVNDDYLLRDMTYQAQILPDDVAQRRKKVVEVAYEMSTLEWTVTEDLTLTANCTCCGNMTFIPGMKYRGIPYAHKTSSLDRFHYCLEQKEDGTYQIADWIYDRDGFDGMDLYIGNDCASAVKMMYSTISNNCSWYGSRSAYPVYGSELFVQQETYPMGDCKLIAVGGWDWAQPLRERDQYLTGTASYIEATGEEEMYECYAQLRAGDLVAYTGHMLFICQEPVVMRDANGKIDPSASYIRNIQQVAAFQSYDGYISSWRVDNQKSFKDLLESGYVPMTVPELVESTDMTPEVAVEEDLDGRLGLTTGIVKANNYIDSVEMVITENDGKEIFRKRMFTTAGKTSDSGSAYWNVHPLRREYDLANFAPAVSQVRFGADKTYHCTIIAYMATGEQVKAKDFVF